MSQHHRMTWSLLSAALGPRWWGLGIVAAMSSVVGAGAREVMSVADIVRSPTAQVIFA